MAITDTMRKDFKALRLSSMLAEYERLADDPGVKGWSVSEYLAHLLEHEVQTRETRAIEKRIKAADFPEILRLEEYDFTRMPTLDEKLIVELHGCDWIRRGDNLVYCGEQETVTYYSTFLCP